MEYGYSHAENNGLVPILEAYSVEASSIDQELDILNEVYDIVSFNRRQIGFSIKKEVQFEQAYRHPKSTRR